MPIENKIALTEEGLKKTKEEYRHLIDVVQPEIVEQLTAARAQGDLSENADYDAARNRQAEVNAKVAELEHILNNYYIVESPVPGTEVRRIMLGNVVTYQELGTGDLMTVKLVGSVEANPLAEPIPSISNECALGRALMDREPGNGERITVESDEPYEIMIVKAENPA